MVRRLDGVKQILQRFKKSSDAFFQCSELYGPGLRQDPSISITAIKTGETAVLAVHFWVNKQISPVHTTPFEYEEDNV